MQIGSVKTSVDLDPDPRAARPEGFFSDAYPVSEERQKLEKAMSENEQRPERRKSSNGRSGKRVHQALRRTIGS